MGIYEEDLEDIGFKMGEEYVIMQKANIGNSGGIRLFSAAKDVGLHDAERYGERHEFYYIYM